MLKKVLGVLWRGTPGRLRTWGARFFQPRFTVSAGAVVIDESGRVLLLKHVFRTGAGWGIPGGFINHGEQPEAAVRRELLEETGLELESAEFAFARALANVHHFEVIFRCRPRGTARARSLEINRIGWFALDQLPEDLGSDQRRIIKRALE
jgi:ADP-ribose pyrophosphatase YjhB (NUDIX family)